MPKTANDFARAAVELNQFAERMKPDPASPYADLENIIVYHIRVAAKDAMRIAEAMAKQEPARP